LLSWAKSSVLNLVFLLGPCLPLYLFLSDGGRYLISK
jgi:hypothetical protein